MKTSRVTKCDFKNEWQSKNGPMYSWYVSFDNGDHAEFNTKSPDRGPWEVGAEANYTTEAKEYKGNIYYKGTKITPFDQGKSGKAWTPDPERESRKERWAKQLMITRQACLNTACQLTANGGAEANIDTLKDTAAELEKWVLRGMDLHKLANPTQNGTPAQAAPAKAPAKTAETVRQPKPALADMPEDDLPF